jgi:phenylalanine-4-hydroxylase
VISSFEGLLEQCYQDFGTLYELETLTDIEPGELAAGDEVITRGTLEHSKAMKPVSFESARR